MSPATAADRILVALGTRHRRVAVGEHLTRALAEINTEAGPTEVARIVHTVEAAAVLGGRAVA